MHCHSVISAYNFYSLASAIFYESLSMSRLDLAVRFRKTHTGFSGYNEGPNNAILVNDKIEFKPY